MKKLTKLLSVFAVAGAMCAGTAALAGCGEEPHKHTPVEHEAKAATCTEVGYSSKYYTCDSTECKDKYYSDEACTTEIDLATITLAATGHTEVYTDKHDGTHGITCEHNDLTETTEAHADTDEDGKCDKCKVTVHKGTLVEEVPADCVTAGTKAHYVTTDEGCEGKFYSDATCTVEVTAESLVIAALGHKYDFVPNLDTTHVKKCSVCGNVEYDADYNSDIDCKDENSDDKCDDCGGDLAFVKASKAIAGTYMNRSSEKEIVITSAGSLIYNDETMALSAAVNGVATCTSADGTEYTLTANRKGYKLSYEMEFYGEKYTQEISFETAPEKLAETKEDLVGVYSGEFTYSDTDGSYKVTKFAFTEGGCIQFTEGTAGANDSYTYATYVTDIAYYDLYYNVLETGLWKFTVTKAEAGVVKEITLEKGNKSAVFTLTDEEVSEVPTQLPLTDDTLYVGGDYRMIAKNIYGDLYYALNDNMISLVSGDETKGYLVYVGGVNYVLKINTTNSSIDLFASDGTIKLATLALTEPTFPEFVADGETVNNNAVVDDFNVNNAYYTVKETGWYTFAGDGAIFSIYTAFDEMSGQPLSWGDSVIKVYPVFDSLTVQLTKGAKIALDSSNATTGFVARYSATEPTATTTPFAGFTAEQCGTYTYEAVTDWGTTTYKFKLTETGLSYDSYGEMMEADYVGTKGDYYMFASNWGTSYSSAVIFKFDADGNMSVLADEINYAQEAYVAVKSADVGGGEDDPSEQKAVEGENTVSAGMTGYVELVLDKVGVWTVTYGAGLDYLAVANQPIVDGGTIEITDTAKILQISVSFTADEAKFTLTLTSGSGEELGGGETSDNALAVGDNTINVTNNSTGTVYTFTATEAGTYTITFDSTAYVQVDGDYPEMIFSGHSITLEANGTFTLLCYMDDTSLSGGTYTLNIAKA